MSTTSDVTLKSPIFPTWCPGCGDYGIWGAIKKALVECNIPEEQLVVVFGVGCSGNMADFLRCYGFHALHGRALPNAEAIKLANHGLKVVVIAGDGDTYGEGMGHFIAACRGNHDITLIVHDNQVYGLTTGQAAPTTPKGRETKSTPTGQIEVPVNPIALAVTTGASFVARGFAGNIPYTTELIKKGIAHKGFALVDVFQPCVTFNHENTHVWYNERVYQLDPANYDATKRDQAWTKSWEIEKLPLGVFYEDVTQHAYHEDVPLLAKGPLTTQFPSTVSLAENFKEYQ
ncbi:MAG TPA: thiamine pyrophosphate-dependent enzyme [Patescibacteria group bacterium]|nr:thiamine pyrophosphate-dependent enzyme [Patescibacteria group bacterium]